MLFNNTKTQLSYFDMLINDNGEINMCTHHHRLYHHHHHHGHSCTTDDEDEDVPLWEHIGSRDDNDI